MLREELRTKHMCEGGESKNKSCVCRSDKAYVKGEKVRINLAYAGVLRIFCCARSCGSWRSWAAGASKWSMSLAPRCVCVCVRERERERGVSLALFRSLSLSFSFSLALALALSLVSLSRARSLSTKLNESKAKPKRILASEP